MSQEDLRKEAAAAEFLSRLISYRPDREWLSANAVELRRLADRLEAHSWLPKERAEGPKPSRSQ